MVSKVRTQSRFSFRVRMNRSAQPLPSGARTKAGELSMPSSTAGKVGVGVITRAGDEGLRAALVVGATSVIQHARRGGKLSPWLCELLKRKSPKLAAVALANKIARIAWKLMVTGENYAVKSASAAPARAA